MDKVYIVHADWDVVGFGSGADIRGVFRTIEGAKKRFEGEIYGIQDEFHEELIGADITNEDMYYTAETDGFQYNIDIFQLEIED